MAGDLQDLKRRMDKLSASVEELLTRQREQSPAPPPPPVPPPDPQG